MLFRSCRYKKCLSSGLQPQLVCRRKNKSKKKTQEEQLAVSVNKDDQQPISDSNSVEVTTAPKILTKYFNIEDNFQNGTVQRMTFSLLDDVFFNYNNAEFHTSSIGVFSSMCREHQEGKQISPMMMFSSVEIARRSNEIFVSKFLELFFPNFGPETIQNLAENVRFSITGIIRALHTCLRFSSLFDQIRKIFFTSENYIKFFMDSFSYTLKIEPFPVPMQVQSC